ncbi:MAG: PEP-CTERM sorting domain-containing protein [Chromatiales bacterium]|jgi:hypothetical protein|nr:PEP-CTERM sorting domain-containing protein [Chromatiales bacterium]
MKTKTAFQSLYGLAGLLLLATSAEAVPLKATGFEYPTGVTQATIVNGVPALNKRVYAGGFVVQNLATNGSFVAWCVDIFQPINFGETVNDYTLTTGVAAFGAARSDAIGRLATLALGQVNNAATSGAFQLALWELVNELTGNALNLSANNFRAGSVTNGSAPIAQGWLNGIANISSQYTVSVWQSRSRQDLVVFERVRVPEPGSLALAVVGLAMVLTLQRRRQLARR